MLDVSGSQIESLESKSLVPSSTTGETRLLIAGFEAPYPKSSREALKPSG